MHIVKGKTIYVTERGSTNKELYLHTIKPKLQHDVVTYKLRALHIGDDGLLYLSGYKLGVRENIYGDNVLSFGNRYNLEIEPLCFLNETEDKLVGGGFLGLGKKTINKVFKEYMIYTGNNTLLTNVYSNFTIYDRCGYFDTNLSKVVLKG